MSRRCTAVVVLGALLVCVACGSSRHERAIDALESQIWDLENRIGDLESELEDVRSAAEDNEYRISDLEARLY